MGTDTQIPREDGAPMSVPPERQPILAACGLVADWTRRDLPFVVWTINPPMFDVDLEGQIQPGGDRDSHDIVAAFAAELGAEVQASGPPPEWSVTATVTRDGVPVRVTVWGDRHVTGRWG